MPTASELVDNRAIVARIHRRRRVSGTSQSDEEDDTENPLISDTESPSLSLYNHLAPFHPGQNTNRENISDDQHMVISGHEHTTYENLSHERRAGGGKWPRQKYIFNSSSVMQSGYRKRSCVAENCVHQFGSSCADILLQPHLYPHICKNKGKSLIK